MRKRILAVVSARGGSKGVPKKNIKKLNGIPLIFYSLNVIKKIKKIDRIILSSEDAKIINLVKNSFKDVEIYKRPKHLADDKTALTEVAKYVSKPFIQFPLQ